MLGFRGHFVTKSRGYFTNLGTLRADPAYRAQQDEPDQVNDVRGRGLDAGAGVLAVPGLGLPEPWRCVAGGWRRSLDPRRPRGVV
jgi:hypothetical protein